MVPMTQNRTTTRNRVNGQILAVASVAVRHGLGLADMRMPPAELNSAWQFSRIPEPKSGGRCSERGNLKPRFASLDAPAGPVGSTPATPRSYCAAAY